MADEKIQVTIEGNPQGGIDMLTAFDKKADDSKKKLEEGSDVDKLMGGLAGKLTQLTLGFGRAAGAATAALGKFPPRPRSGQSSPSCATASYSRTSLPCRRYCKGT